MIGPISKAYLILFGVACFENFEPVAYKSFGRFEAVFLRATTDNRRVLVPESCGLFVRKRFICSEHLMGSEWILLQLIFHSINGTGAWTPAWTENSISFRAGESCLGSFFNGVESVLVRRFNCFSEYLLSASRRAFLLPLGGQKI